MINMYIFIQEVREMIYHAYHSYMTHAYPYDELKPLSCEGRRWDQKERGTLDDVLSGTSVTLIDSLDTLALLNDTYEFRNAVQLIIKDVTFDRDVTVSVFETRFAILLRSFVFMLQFI